jgi:Ca2+-binding EF-hand superfamily protein
MKTSTLLAALLVGLAPLSAASAQDASGRVFQRIDANGDGVISKDEIVAARDRRFQRLDKNRDGMIDRDEVDAARDAIMDRADAAQARLGNAWRRMDANGDGKVSEEEFRASTPLFDLVDRNGDGKLSADEIALIRNLVAGRRG